MYKMAGEDGRTHVYTAGNGKRESISKRCVPYVGKGRIGRHFYEQHGLVDYYNYNLQLKK